MKRILFLSGVIILTVAGLSWADGFIVPRPIPPDGEFPPNLSVRYHRVNVEIANQVAQTSVDQVFVNHHHRDIEGTYIFPISAQAAVSDFSMFMGNEEVRGKILDRTEARRIYEEIVRRRRDPALLEYFGDGMFQASVYPIPAHGETRVKLHYSEILKRDSGVCEYRYTLGTERFSRDPLESVEIRIRIESKAPITSVYSPSHDIRVEREGDYRASVTYVEERSRPDRDFLLYYGVSTDEIGVDVLAYEDDDREKFFLALVAPRTDLDAARMSSKDILFVLDTSGSMQGDKIAQAKGALEFCLNGLGEGDRFNVIDFDDGIDPFKSSLVAADHRNVREALSFVERCAAEGGTNINDALLEALAQIARTERPSFVIFLTDGLPTVGETDVQRILTNVKKANRSQTRLFVFGVGYDVNTRLLDRLAGDHHGVSDYVHPSEDIEVKVSQFFTKVSHPILTRVELSFENVEAFDIYPRELPDIFEGSEIIVLGKYRGDGHVKAILSGRSRNGTRRLDYDVNFSARGRNDFLPRLWATRKIGYLIDELRLHRDDEELVEEVVRLSKKYGVITEHTSYLVDADYRTAMNDLVAPAQERIRESAELQTGSAAVNRTQADKMVAKAPRALEAYKDSEGKEHRITRVAQGGARTFYNKGRLWVDSAFEGTTSTVKVKRFSTAYFELLNRAPEVAKYYALGDSVIFMMGRTAVEISDDGKSDLSASELRSLVGSRTSE